MTFQEFLDSPRTWELLRDAVDALAAEQRHEARARIMRRSPSTIPAPFQSELVMYQTKTTAIIYY